MHKLLPREEPVIPQILQRLTLPREAVVEAGEDGVDAEFHILLPQLSGLVNW